MSKGFIKLMRGSKTFELLLQDGNAFHLLTVIALRAQRTNGFNVKNLKPGEALVGDYRNYGLTRREYRTAIKNLKACQFVTTKATNKGTIARLTDNSIYDINPATDRPTDRPADGQQTANKPATTKERINNEKKNNKKTKQSVEKLRSGKKPVALVAGRDNEIVEAMKNFADAYNRLLRPVTKRDKTTFQHHLAFLVRGVESGKFSIDAFRQAEDFVKRAKTDGVKAGGKALFSVLMKEHFGFNKGRTKK